MGAKKPIKLLNTSLVKLDFAIEEILLELSAMLATNNNSDVRELISKYEKLSNKADKLRTKAEKLIKDNSKKKSIVKKNSNTTYVKSVNFTDVHDIKTDSTIGELPVDAVLYKKNICDVKITVAENKRYIIRKGSIICKGDISSINKIKSSEIVELRHKISKDKTFAKKFIPTGFNSEKLVLKKDITIDNAKALMEFVYGRSLLPKDSINDIKVHGKGLNIYFKTGSIN